MELNGSGGGGRSRQGAKVVSDDVSRGRFVLGPRDDDVGGGFDSKQRHGDTGGATLSTGGPLAYHRRLPKRMVDRIDPVIG